MQQFPTDIPVYPDTAGNETLNALGGGLGLSRILDDHALDIIAMAIKMGYGASTPSAGKVLRSSGDGVSSWGAVVLSTDVSGTLPVANGGTGIGSFGSGIATFLGTPTSANLRAAVTDETGTGAMVFAASPTIVTPTIASFVNAAHDHTNAANGGDVKKIDYGVLSTLNNPYKFAAYANATVTITAATQKVALNTVLFDPASDFDTALNRYVVPVDGYYQLNAQAGIGSAGMGGTEHCRLGLYKNGVLLKLSAQMDGSGTATRLPRPNISTYVYLEAGDYLELFALMGGVYRDIVGGSTITFFEGYLESIT